MRCCPISRSSSFDGRRGREMCCWPLRSSARKQQVGLTYVTINNPDFYFSKEKFGLCGWRLAIRDVAFDFCSFPPPSLFHPLSFILYFSTPLPITTFFFFYIPMSYKPPIVSRTWGTRFDNLLASPSISPSIQGVILDPTAVDTVPTPPSNGDKIPHDASVFVGRYVANSYMR